MAKYGSNSIVVEFDDSTGSSLKNMTQYILDINDVTVEALVEESHTFGDAWFESLATGIKRMGEITLRGFYDDTATTGPDVIFNAVGNTTLRTLQITWGGTKTTSVETIIKSYKRMPTRGELTKFEVVLVPTGTVTEA